VPGGAGRSRLSWWRRFIVTLPHAIGRQALEVDVATESQATALLDRVGDLNRASLLPTIERVMDEFDEPDLVVIERIDLDIGTVPAARLELAADRLETALRDALMRALEGRARPEEKNADAPDMPPTGAALLELLAQYLLRGTWPYRAHNQLGDPAALLSGLIESEPQALVQWVRRHGAQAVERLGKQMPFPVLERLLHLLEPERAAAMLAAMPELAAPSDAALARRLWPLVLSDVLTQADAAFDADSVAHRLRAQVTDGEASDDVRSHEIDLAPPAAAPIDLLEQFLLHGSWSGTKPEALLLQLASDDPDALARLFRRHARNDAMLRRVTEIMSAAALGRLLSALDPEAAAPILAYMIDIRTLHRAEPIAPLSDPALARLLWHIALRYVLREAGSQFNRRSFVARLIEDVATEERLSYREVLAALRLGVAEMAKSNPVATSLPAIIDELAAALEPAAFPVELAATAELERLLRDGAQIPAAELRRMIARARKQDPLGLRRLLQRYAQRDPARLTQTLGAALTMPALIGLLLRADAARDVAAMMLRLASLPAVRAIPTQRLNTAIVAAVASFGDAAAGGPRLMARIVRSVAKASGVTPDRLAASLSERAEPARASDAQAGAIDADDIAALYARLDQLRHVLRTGVLPWRDVLAEPGLTPHWLVESLEQVRPGLVRAALAGLRVQRSTLRKALARLTEADVARVTGWLAPDSPAARELAAAIAATRAKASTAAAGLETVESLLAALAEGIGQRAAPADWTELLLRLATRDPRAARRFLAAVAQRPAGLARLGVLCAPTLLPRLLAALVPAAAATLAMLGESLIAHGAQRAGGEQAIVEALLAEALSIEADTVPGLALVARVLRRLFGDASPPSLAPALRRDLLRRLPGGVAAVVDAAIGEVLLSRRRDAEPDAAAAPDGAHTEWLFRALGERDLARASPDADVPDLLRELLGQMLDAPSAELAVRLVAFLHQARNRAELIRLLPERLLARLIMHAVPHAGRGLLEAGELLAETAREAGHPLDRAALWHALLATAAAPAGERTVARLAGEMFAAIGRAADGAGVTQRDAPAEALLQAAVRRARDAGHAALVAVLSERRGELVTAYAGLRQGGAARTEHPPLRARPARPIRARTAFRLASEDDVPSSEPIYIANAGLVLANPFLPRLFDVLGLIERGEDGKPRLAGEAASRGVHLLQYLVDGRTDRAEPLLVLNKLMCGLPVATPVERAIEPTEAERETCDTLLASMLGNWPALRNTSIAGLRETFLQREGKLLRAGAWRLQVQRKTLDVLVDQLPWSIGVVFHPWMPGAIHVTW
jgi:hypothetical protein